MKAKKFLILASSLAYQLATAQPPEYGQVLYPHPPGIKMSHGSAVSNGYLMACYSPSSFPIALPAYEIPPENPGPTLEAIPTPNFYIDKTDWFGHLNNGWVQFQKEYNIFANENCGTPSRVYNCSGISMVEAKRFSIVEFDNWALAGTCDEGCFFSLLDWWGNPIYSKLYKNVFVDPSIVGITTYSKPRILAAQTSINGQQEFFICYNFTFVNASASLACSQVLRIDHFGNIIWQIPLFGSFNAMVEKSGPNPDLIVVGENGSIVQLSYVNGACGGALAGRRYYSPGTNCNFSSICLAHSNSPGGSGYIIGGTNDPINNTGKALLLKITESGAFVWSTLVTPSSDVNAGDIVDVIERVKTDYITYDFEYFGVTNSVAGIMTLKFDANGIPITNGEYIYNAGTANDPSTANSIGFMNDQFDTGGVFYNPYYGITDLGLCIFGTDKTYNSSAQYLTQAFYTGESGCNTPVDVLAYEHPGFSPVYGLPASWFYAESCDEIYLTTNDVSSRQLICGPYEIYPPSNSRQNSITSLNEKSIPDNQFLLYPNPTKDVAFMDYQLREVGQVTINLYNSLGQHLKTILNSKQEGRSYQIEINLKELNIESGIYFLCADLNGVNSSKKIIFQKE